MSVGQQYSLVRPCTVLYWIQIDMANNVGLRKPVRKRERLRKREIVEMPMVVVGGLRRLSNDWRSSEVRTKRGKGRGGKERRGGRRWSQEGRGDSNPSPCLSTIKIGCLYFDYDFNLFFC